MRLSRGRQALLDETVRTEIEEAAGNKGITDWPLAASTTMGCGGPAAMMIEAGSGSRLTQILAAAQNNNLSWFVLGHGSNLLVADEGWQGLVVKLGGKLKDVICRGERLECGGGAGLPKAAKAAVRAGLSGLESLAHIPGTIGGAVAMNAGAYGSSIGDLVVEVEVCRPGETKAIDAANLRFGYRTGDIPAGSVVSRVILELIPGDPEVIAEKMADLRRQREASQPIREKSCGSVFKNPPGGKSAGFLLDEAGCKGLASGGAAVSGIHANFIINRGDATAGDVIDLMNRCRHMVKESSGVILEPEVRFLGDIGLVSI